MRSHLTRLGRRRLAHVVPACVPCSTTMFLHDLIYSLPEYEHTVYHETPLSAIQAEMIWVLQADGASVLHKDTITPELLEQQDGAILYGVQGHKDLGRVCPTIYYAHGVYDSTPGYDILVHSSIYSATWSNKGELQPKAPVNAIVPPAVNVRRLRALRKRADWPFTVAVLTGATDNKYPTELMSVLMEHTDPEIGLLLSRPPDDDNIVIKQARAHYDRGRKNLHMAPIRPTTGIYYLMHADIFIYGRAPTYHTPYGRMLVEAMAAGLPVICEQRCAPSETLENGKQVLFYDGHTQLLEHVKYLRERPKVASQLAANGHLWASWQDLATHVGTIKGLLRELGV